MNIRVENLQKSFILGDQIEVKALRNVDLEIKSGETVSIIGPSGAGKSTLLHILGLMDSPTKGKIFIDNEDFSAKDSQSRARIRKQYLGFLFQMHYLLPEFTVWENTILPIWDKRFEKEKKVKSLLNELGLSERLNHLPNELSGGEQQRTALARALVNEPKIFFADEPTGNLDRETGEKVENIIFQECKTRKITLVIVTHNEDLAKKSNRIIKMRDGNIVHG